MDWNFAIEKHKQALKRVLAMLVAMAGLAEGKLPGTVYFFPQISDVTSMPGSGGKKVNCPQRFLPRHLHRAILRLLRPAEAAARRLIVVAARGLTVQLAPSRRPILCVCLCVSSAPALSTPAFRCTSLAWPMSRRRRSASRATPPARLFCR